MERDHLPISEYEKLPPRFNPAEFDPETWSARRPEGRGRFPTWSSRPSTTTASPHVREQAHPLRRDRRHALWQGPPQGSSPPLAGEHGLPLIVSYSLLDWHHPRLRTSRPDRPSRRDAMARRLVQICRLLSRTDPRALHAVRPARRCLAPGRRRQARRPLGPRSDLQADPHPATRHALVANDHQNPNWPLPDVPLVRPRNRDRNTPRNRPSPRRSGRSTSSWKRREPTRRSACWLPSRPRGRTWPWSSHPRHDGASPH